MRIYVDRLAKRLEETGETVTSERLEELFLFRRNRITRKFAELDPRNCEVHLAASLAAARQAIQERSLVFATGEKLANLDLAEFADDQAVSLLSSEASVIGIKRNISSAGVSGEEAVGLKYQSQMEAQKTLNDQIDPTRGYGKSDANRFGIVAHVARRATRDEGDPVTRSQYTDEAWGPTDKNEAIPKGMHVADVEMDLATRVAKASFRLSQARGSVEAKAIDVQTVASQGRLRAQQATASYDEAAFQLSGERATAASKIATERKKLAGIIELLGFYQQMVLSWNRAFDLADDCREFALAAGIGLNDIYGMSVESVPGPAVNPQDFEILLAWCRKAARAFLPLQSSYATDRIRCSMKQEHGDQWREVVANGASIKLDALASLGRVIRVRDVTVCVKEGARLPRAFTRVVLPQEFVDHSVDGKDNNSIQTAQVIIAPQGQNINSGTRPQSCAPLIHNCGAAGTWTIYHDAADLAGIEDLTLEIDLSYLSPLPLLS